MKKDESVNCMLLNVRCNYTHFVIANYNIILTCHLYREFKVYKNLSYPFIIEKNLKEKGNKFMLRLQDLGMNIFYELKESIITDYYSKFKYYIYKTIPESITYYQQVEVRYINEDECTILSTLIYNNNIIFPEKDIQAVVQLQKNLYNSIALSMRNYTVLKLATAYTTINSNIELIWNIIRNMKLVHKYVHLFGDEIKYNGELIKKDIIIKLINIKRKKSFISIAKVNKCKMIKNESFKECLIELLFQKKKSKEKKDLPPFSVSKIILRIYELNRKCSVYILYFFVNIQDFVIMENFTKMKNKELFKFKNIVEHYKETSEKNDSKQNENSIIDKNNIEDKKNEKNDNI